EAGDFAAPFLQQGRGSQQHVAVILDQAHAQAVEHARRLAVAASGSRKLTGCLDPLQAVDHRTRAATFHGTNADPHPHQRAETPDDGQTQAHALDIAVALLAYAVELLEDAVQMPGGYAAPLVIDLDGNLRATTPTGDQQRLARSIF